jgi:hypothetical protein
MIESLIIPRPTSITIGRLKRGQRSRLNAVKYFNQLLICSSTFLSAATVFGVAMTPTYAVEADSQMFANHWQRALEQAVCLQNWHEAVEAASSLMASSAISASYRSDLVSYRHQLLHYRSLNLQFDRIAGCEPILAQIEQAKLQPPAEPAAATVSFDWETAIYQLEERMRRDEADELPRPTLVAAVPRSAVMLQRGPILDRNLRDRTYACQSRLSLCDR